MRKLIEMQLVEFKRVDFDESVWRQQFEGIEEVYPQVANADEFLAARSDISFFNPGMQLEENPGPDVLHLIVPIWA